MKNRENVGKTGLKCTAGDAEERRGDRWEILAGNVDWGVREIFFERPGLGRIARDYGPGMSGRGMRKIASCDGDTAGG